MTEQSDGFDWMGVWSEAWQVWHRTGSYQAAADYLRARVTECIAEAKWFLKHTDTINTTVQMGMARDDALARADAAEAKVARLREALQMIANKGGEKARKIAREALGEPK